MDKLSVDDVKKIPHGLLLESIYALQEIGKMGDSRPKTVKALKNAIKPACRVYYLIRLDEVFKDKKQKSNDVVQKRRRPGFPPEKKKRRQVYLGTEVKLKTVYVNPINLFLPDGLGVKKLLDQEQRGGNTRRYRYRPTFSTVAEEQKFTVDQVASSVIQQYNANCQRCERSVRKLAEKQAEYWSSSIAVANQEQVAAAAAAIFDWLKPPGGSQVSMEIEGASNDGPTFTNLKVFPSKQELLAGIAEKCVGKEKYDAQQIIDRLVADGFIKVNGDSTIEYPEDQTATWIYDQAEINYDTLLSSKFDKLSTMVREMAQGLAYKHLGSTPRKEKKRGGVSSDRGRRMMRGGARMRGGKRPRFTF